MGAGWLGWGGWGACVVSGALPWAVSESAGVTNVVVAAAYVMSFTGAGIIGVEGSWRVRRACRSAQSAQSSSRPTCRGGRRGGCEMWGAHGAAAAMDAQVWSGQVAIQCSCCGWRALWS